MSEKYARKKSNDLLLTKTSINNKSQRSRSITNLLEQEPKLRPARILTRRTTVATNLTTIKNIEKTKTVTQLIKQFEHSKSTNNVNENIQNFHLSSSSIANTTKPVFSNNVQIRTIKTTQIPRKALIQSFSVPNQSFPNPELEVQTLTHTCSHSISDNINENDQITSITKQSNDSHIEVSETTSIDSTIGLTQETFPLSEELIKYRSNDNLKKSFDENKTILLECIHEIYTTEKTYIKTLDILSSKLPSKIKELCSKHENLIEIFNKIYQPLLNTIHQLYKFHNEIIFPYIEQYETNYHTDNIWSIFSEHFQTIEDLYKSYYVTYDEYQRELKRLNKSDELKKLHKAMFICQIYFGNLCPITEFNCPNQRLVRYILLIKRYMKYYDKNSSEYEYINFIYEEFSRIATRCEEQLIISLAEINRLKVRIDSKLDYFENQKLLWHGSLKKQSQRKRNDISQFYLILFSHCIIVCEEYGNKLEIKRQLSIENLTIDIMDNKQITSTLIYYPFRINTIEKSYEFLVEKESDREKWINKLKQATKNFQNQLSIIDTKNFSNKQQIGLHAPIFVCDNDVTRCQICNIRFGLKLTPSSRHHCRSCGRCICGSCSTKKLILKYCFKNGEVRICDICYTFATGINRYSISSLKITRNPSKTILFGNFRCISTNSIVWIELQDDYQLHIYNGKLDQVEDFSINIFELRDILFIEETHTFIFNSKDKRYKYSIESNHQNNYIDENINSINNKQIFYTKLWLDAIQLARLKRLPLWYIRKRDSTDSGICAV